MKQDPASLTARQAASQIRQGLLSSVDLVKACLARIEQSDSLIGAWSHLDPEQALEQAAELDRVRRSGFAIGALHGVPVGLKDIVDTAGMPTERGTPIFAGRQPDADAAIVERLREAGAVIMGKTVTTELAFLNPSRTRNPHNPDRTPGGSSSGSAAAVAAHHVPLAIGTQTNGSVIRPASFCGVYGFKPTRGIISRRGILQTSASLDQVGVFARSLEDAALLTDAISSYDQTDPASVPRPRPAMARGAAETAPVDPDFAFFDMPFHDRLAGDAREGLEAVAETLGKRVSRLQPADTMTGLVSVQATIHEYEICMHLNESFDAHWGKLSPVLQTVVERGRKISTARYEDALAVKASAEKFFADFFVEFDAIVAPSAAGEAPLFDQGTGDPIFCTLWTLAGLPTITLPLLVGDNDLPIGVQLIGPAEKDDRLLRTASWLQTRLAEGAA
ncbi:Asp-tRNAAsn/Glu-tRNAGln amidotransferase A subunit family amidase [Hoeflea halophila]|uniref:Asp-tRNAAsn/Glu-tRNAGln amidotransferase A subunit family amidase n=1 Tax=Hoeflea halophila TaxID=714899 RepID=A0A286I9Y9_9HYPH|nr:amidase [Hoeflea halophila]SOE16456.1 Asp-tRNAAsn/Glu-tRNAGln amidotransferase A subunit family amidase [Hoeflea halophila]